MHNSELLRLLVTDLKYIYCRVLNSPVLSVKLRNFDLFKCHQRVSWRYEISKFPFGWAPRPQQYEQNPFHLLEPGFVLHLCTLGPRFKCSEKNLCTLILRSWALQLSCLLSRSFPLVTKNHMYFVPRPIGRESILRDHFRAQHVQHVIFRDVITE